jgi:hypothetical protein
MSIDLLPQLKELRLYGIYEVWAVIKAEAQQGNKATRQQGNKYCV